MSSRYYSLFLGLIVVLSAILVACSEPEPTPGAIDDREPALQSAANTQPTESPAETAASPATSTADVAPTGTPVAAAPTPIASFTTDVTSGSAPVVVSFQNTSSGTASSVEWDFGDGNSSTEQSPSHSYTATGTYTVQLKLAGPGGTDTIQIANLITVSPGPPTRLEVSPAEATLAVQDSVQFTVMGRDEFGNELPATAEWSVVAGGGSIDVNGLFSADTRAGSFPDTIQASLRTEAGEITTAASVTVEPGALASVTVEPPEVTLNIGETQSFSFAAVDTFGNPIFDARAAWTTPVEAGEIDREGVFTAGTKAGEFPGAIQVEVVNGTSRASAPADVSIKVGPLAQIKIEPQEAIVRRNEQLRFTAVAQDQYGNEIPEVALLWEANGGAISQDGSFVAGGDPGNYEVRVSASFQGIVSIGVAPVGVPPVWIAVGRMAQVRTRHSAVAFPDDRVLLVGRSNTAEIYDPETRTFQDLGEIPCSNGIHNSMTLLKDGMVLIVGGSQDPRCALTFDPETDAFQRVGDMNEDHFRHTATLLTDGKVLIAGGVRRLEGEGNYGAHAVAEVYDPVTQTFSRTGDLNGGRQNHAANLLPSGKVLIASGVRRKTTNGENFFLGRVESVEIYDTATRAFNLLPGAVITFAAITSPLSDGNVLFTPITGGAAWIFDSSREQFRTTGFVAVVHHGPITSTLLHTGQVLIVGGHDEQEISITTVEIYDPAGGTYSITASLREPRNGHTATLLSNGWVLITGGYDGETELRSAELFIPSSLP